jgi:hypothetical protein
MSLEWQNHPPVENHCIHNNKKQTKSDNQAMGGVYRNDALLYKLVFPKETTNIFLY